MTLDTTAVITLTDASLDGGNALCAHAGQIAGMTTMGSAVGTKIIVVGSSASEQQTMERRSAALCSTGDLLCRANLVTLPAIENAQRLVGLLQMMGADATLLDPVAYAPITRGHALEAEPRLLHARRFEDASRRGGVLVIAGGVGRTPEGETTSLGTGGAELSGLFIAQRLGLPVRLIVSDKDAASGYAMPKRAALFARKHGLHYGVSLRFGTTRAEEVPVPA